MTEDKNEGLKSYQVVDRRTFDSEGNERDESVTAAQSAEAAASQAAAKSHGASPSASSAQANGAPKSIQAENQEAVDPARASAHATSAAAYEAATSEFAVGGAAQEGDVSFTSFVMSLATQSLVQLGEMDPPPGMEIPADIESARQTIDVIQMLQRKTRGNLSSDEARFIEEVLHTVRMSYVRRAK